MNTYSQRQLEARAARLQAIADDWHSAPVEWVENIRMEVWALRLAISLITGAESAVRRAARSQRTDITMEQFARVRDKLVNRILDGELSKLL